MRLVIRGLFAFLLVVGPFAPAASAAPRLQVLLDSLQAGYGRAREARRGGDLAGYERELVRVVGVVPNMPRLTYRLAGAHALLGRRDEALHLLDRVVRLGAGFDAPEDPDFASLRGDPAFDSLAARIRAARAPVGSSEIAFRLPERDLFPEGIAHDSVSGTFFLSSLYKRKIVAIDSTGSARDFTGEGQDSLWCGLGMKVDARRRRLWVATSVEEFMRAFRKEELYRAALLCYDVDSGRLRTRSVLPNHPYRTSSTTSRSPATGPSTSPTRSRAPSTGPTERAAGWSGFSSRARFPTPTGSTCPRTRTVSTSPTHSGSRRSDSRTCA